MPSRTLLKFTVSATIILFLPGCLMRQKVTSGGQVVKDGYVVKRPLKEAIRKSR